MPSDPKQVILIVVPVVALSIALITLFIVIFIKMRRRFERQILPTAQKSGPAMSAVQQPPNFTQRHLANLRDWQKPTNPASASIVTAYATIKTDSSHRTFQLAPPSAAHQKSQKGSWQQFQEKKQQRALARENAPPIGKWHHKPKGPAYWCEVGKEMEARKTWWEKAKDRVGM